MTGSDQITNAILHVLRKGKPWHSGEICAQLERNGVPVHPVVLGRRLHQLSKELPTLVHEGSVEVPSGRGYARQDVWRLEKRREA